MLYNSVQFQCVQIKKAKTYAAAKRLIIKRLKVSYGGAVAAGTLYILGQVVAQTLNNYFFH